MDAKGIAFDGVDAGAGAYRTANCACSASPSRIVKRRMGVALARGANIDEARVRAKQAAALIKTEKS